MHEKNNLNFVFGLSEVHASKEQFKFCFWFKWNTFMKKKILIFVITSSEIHAFKEQNIFVLD